MDGVIAALSKSENLAVLVLVAVNVGLFMERRESGRRTVESIEKLAETVTNLRLTLAELMGKK